MFMFDCNTKYFKEEKIMGKKKVDETVNECSACDDKAQCPETGAPEAAGEGTAPENKERKVMDANYQFVKFPGEGEKKLPLQAKQILEILEGAGKESDAEDAPYAAMSRKDLLDRMKDVVQTRQPIERILGFYQPTLTKLGYVIMKK